MTSAPTPRTAPMAIPAIAPLDIPPSDGSTLTLEVVGVVEADARVTGTGGAVVVGP
jgi:hypothetical protein